MSVDNRTQANDCDDDTTTFSTTGASLGTNTEAGNTFEGASSVEAAHSNAFDDTWTTDDTAGTALNIDMTDMTAYLVVKDNGYGPSALTGAMIVIGDGTDRIGYTVGGTDAVGLLPLANVFGAFKLDVSVVITTPGTADVDHHVFTGSEANLDHSAISQFGYGSLHTTKAKSVNMFLDGLYYIANGSYALTINGGTVGTPETMADVQGDDETNGWGMVGNPLGSQYIFFAPTQWGDVATADSYFTATDEQWYLLGDNAGGHVIGANNFPFRLIGNATGTNSFVLTRVVTVNTGVRAQFDLSDANMDIVKLDGCVFTDVGAITMPDDGTVANYFCVASVFNNCDQIDLQALTCDGCTFNGTTDADGAIIWDEGTTDPAAQDNLTFNSDGTGNAIEVAPTGAGPFTYNIDGYTFDGYAGDSGTAADRVFFINPSTLSADITINLSNSTALNIVGGGSGFSNRQVGSYTGTLLIQQTVNLTVQANDADGNGIGGARVRIEESPGGTLVSDGTADGTGEHTDTYAFSSDQAVLIKVRLKGYKPFRTTGTITSDGITVTATMQRDRIVDLP